MSDFTISPVIKEGVGSDGEQVTLIRIGDQFVVSCEGHDQSYTFETEEEAVSFMEMIARYD